eukprot:9980945-Alexandrium_andersonii.AAC.1
MLSCRPAVGCSVLIVLVQAGCVDTVHPITTRVGQPAARQQARWEEALRTATTQLWPAGCRPTFTAASRKIPPRAAIGYTSCKHGQATAGASEARRAPPPARWLCGRRQSTRRRPTCGS